jgi:hypothetical protein
MAEMEAENKYIAHHDENQRSEARNGNCVVHVHRRDGKGDKGDAGASGSTSVQSSPVHPQSNGPLFFFLLFCFFVLLGFSGGRISAGNDSSWKSQYNFYPKKMKGEKGANKHCIQTAPGNETPDVLLVFFGPIRRIRRFPCPWVSLSFFSSFVFFVCLFVIKRLLFPTVYLPGKQSIKRSPTMCQA